jgi:polysaccharide export outer membrane protein
MKKAMAEYQWDSAVKKIIIFSAVLLSACSSTGLRDGEGTAAALAAPGHDYLIGPGDSVNIMVWRNPDVSMSVAVRPDGKITTPLVEDLQASGKTSTELAREIEKSLARYIQQPVVTVIVTGFAGPYAEQIRVIGEAAKPQALPYRQGMSLMDVLITVGGITDFAAGNKASVIRVHDGNRYKLPVRLNDLLRDGDISADMPMRPGDVLLIPESFF